VEAKTISYYNYNSYLSELCWRGEQVPSGIVSKW